MHLTFLVFTYLIWFGCIHPTQPYWKKSSPDLDKNSRQVAVIPDFFNVSVNLLTSDALIAEDGESNEYGDDTPSKNIRLEAVYKNTEL